MSQSAYRVIAHLPDVRLDRLAFSFKEASQVFVDWLESLQYHRQNVHGEVFEVLEITDGEWQTAEEGNRVANILTDGTVIGYDAQGNPRIYHQRSPDDALTTEPLMVKPMVHLHLVHLLKGLIEAVEGHHVDPDTGLFVYGLTVPQLEAIRTIAQHEIVRSVYHGTRQHEFDLAAFNARTAVLRLMQASGVEEVDQDPDDEPDAEDRLDF